MTPEQLAQVHAAAFIHERSWSAAEFTTLLAQPFIHLFFEKGGFALVRTLAGESELLTLAVAPEHQRQGIARRLLIEWIEACSQQADTAFLEVAADNIGALTLYDSLFFQRSNLRKAYYSRVGAASVDAVLMTRVLTQG